MKNLKIVFLNRKRVKAVKLSILIVPFVAGSLMALQMGVLTVDKEAGLDGIEYLVKAGLMKHDGVISDINGRIQFDPSTGNFLAGEFQIPISNMATGNAKRDCHMREALGIDYSRSRFPDKHVCKQDELPMDGVDSVVYPNVELSIESLVDKESGLEINFMDEKLDHGAFVLASVLWKIHGKVVLQDIEAQVSREARGFRFKGETTLHLSEFDIQVKPFLGIDVKDNVKLKVNVLLATER